jgi:hypothetical protein
MILSARVNIAIQNSANDMAAKASCGRGLMLRKNSRIGFLPVARLTNCVCFVIEWEDLERVLPAVMKTHRFIKPFGNGLCALNSVKHPDNVAVRSAFNATNVKDHPKCSGHHK